MSGDHRGVSVPVHRDKRNLEEKHRDLVTNLNRTYNQFQPGSKSSQSIAHYPCQGWPDEVTRWVGSTARLWSDVMRRMRQNAFVLVVSSSCIITRHLFTN